MMWWVRALHTVIMAMVALLGASAITPAFAADCKLALLGTLPVTIEGARISTPVKINGKEQNLWLDSGAFFSWMSPANATQLGLQLHQPPSGFFLSGIGGSTSAMIGVAKTFSVLGHDLMNVEFVVGGSDAGNAVIGRNLLAIGDTEFDFAHGAVKLFETTNGCAKYDLAYWAKDNPYFVTNLEPNDNPRSKDFNLKVTINKATINAAFDSGAPQSLISRHAAERAGINLQGPGVVPISGISGIGRRQLNGWVVPVDNISIGDESVLNAHLTVIDGAIIDSLNAPDMLLGLDYMMTHQIYVAREPRKIFFTYSGGNFFASRKPAATPSTPPTDTATGAQKPADVAATPPIPAGKQRIAPLDEPEASPQTADDYARRGELRLSRNDAAGGIADFSEAIRLSPETAAFYRDRAQAYAHSHHGDLAWADLDKAVALAPNDGALFLARAALRLDNDKPGTLEDADKAARLLPASSLQTFELASIWELAGQPQRSIPALDALIASHHDDAHLGDMLNARCWARGLANVESDKALEDCNSAIRKEGARPAFLDNRGLVHLRRREWALVIADYDAALKINPKLAWSLYGRGIARIASGAVAAGQDDQAAARALQPNIGDMARQYAVGS